MSSLTERLNLSILAIPAYHILAIIPHAAAALYVTNGRPSKWDNCNFRTVILKSAIAKRVDATQYATYERLEAAHANSMENMPIFVAAVILGNKTGLHKTEGCDSLAWFTGAFLLVRTAFILVYAVGDTQAKSYARSLLYDIGVGLFWRNLSKQRQNWCSVVACCNPPIALVTMSVYVQHQRRREPAAGVYGPHKRLVAGLVFGAVMALHSAYWRRSASKRLEAAGMRDLLSVLHVVQE